MDRRRPEFLERREVLGRRVAAVAIEQVAGVTAVVEIHATVPGDLRENRRRGDAADTTIGADQTGLRKGEVRDRKPVDQDMGRNPFQPLDCQAHRTKRGATNVPAIDAERRNRPDRPSEASSKDQRDQGSTLLGTQELGVTQSGDPRPGSEDDGCGDDGAGETAAPHFINARDERESGAS